MLATPYELWLRALLRPLENVTEGGIGLHTYIYTHTNIHICTHKYSVWVYMTAINKHKYIYIYTHKYTCIHTNQYIYTQTYRYGYA